MIKNRIHIVLIILIILLPENILGQATFNNNGGTVKNGGTIRVKNGNARLPDTLDGRIEFLQGNHDSQQRIPNIVYHQLVVANKASKIVSDEKNDAGVVRSIVVRDSLIVADSALFTTRWNGVNSQDIHAKSTVANTAKYRGNKDLVFSGEERSQDLLGNGSFSRVRIENPFGVDVKGGGGFVIEEQLTLAKGELRNDADNNFTMLDSSLIVRHVGGELKHEPLLEKQINIQYTGEGSLTTGAEIPKDENALKNLYANVSETVNLDRNVYVSDTLEVGSYITAINDTLTLQGGVNPRFVGGPEIEIDGNFRRNTLLTGERILLNNRNTWVTFASEAGKNGTQSIVSTIRPKTAHNLPFGNEKVQRTFELWGLDSEGNRVTGDVAMEFGFGWRHLPGAGFNESNDLVPEEVVLQNWINDQWIDIEPRSEVAVVDFGSNWAKSLASDLNRFGVFALGLPGGAQYFYAFRASLYLEGPYIAGSRGFMRHDLWDRNLIASADLAAYPTNLDMNLAPDFLTQIPDSVVDIVVLEFRKERNAAPTFMKTGYLKYDGTFVDRFGRSAIRIDQNDGIQPQGGKFYVAVRHRNHSAIITDEPLELLSASSDTVYNLSDPNVVEGGAASLKLVYVDAEGQKVYALRGGFLTEDAEGLDGQMNIMNYYTRRFEHQRTFLSFTNEGYLNTDFNLSGIVTTLDFNMSWNNRGLR